MGEAKQVEEELRLSVLEAVGGGVGGCRCPPLLPADSDQCLEKIPASADRQT